MTGIDRRHVRGGLVIGGTAISAAAAAAPVELAIKDYKKTAQLGCIYHCDFGDAARFSQQLRNINTHLAQYNYDRSKLKVVIVTHAAGIKYFLEDLAGTPWEQERLDPELDTRMKALGKRGVEVFLCKFTFKSLNIDQAQARPDPYIRFVPSGIAAAAALQAKGFSYVKVG